MAGPEGKKADVEKKDTEKSKSSPETQTPRERSVLFRKEVEKTGETEAAVIDKLDGNKDDKEEMKDAQAEEEVKGAEISAVLYGSTDGIKTEFAKELFTTVDGTKVGVGAYSFTKPGEQNKGYGEGFLSLSNGSVEVGAGVGKQGGEIGNQMMFYCTYTTENQIAITYYGAKGADSFTHGALAKIPINEKTSLNTVAYITHDLGKESGNRPALTNFLGTLGLTHEQLTAGAYVSVDPDKLGLGFMVGGKF